MHRAFLLLAPIFAVATLLTGCPYGDVGAPCSHGKIEPVPSRRITFPALSCDGLLCIYAENDQPVPDVSGGCNADSDCNPGGGSANVCTPHEDQSKRKCAIGIEHVLKYSMCSKKCKVDDDCKNTGITTENRPVAKENACADGFVCKRLQKLGEFCCEPICVCRTYVTQDDDTLGRQCDLGEVTCDGAEPEPQEEDDGED